MARVMAFCLNAQPGLVFTKGLSEVEEPDIWVRTSHDNTSLWVDVGEPAPERIKKAVRKADSVKVYSFNSKSQVWWEQNKSKLVLLDAQFYQFEYSQIKGMSSFLARTMDMSVTITGDSAFIASQGGELELSWKKLERDLSITDVF